MKRKLIISLLALVSAATLAIGLSACNKKPVHEHEFEEVVVAPTCTEDGSTTHICSCGYKYGENIPATGHAWGDWQTVTPAGCTNSGSEKRVCANDPSHVETRDIAPLGHTLEHIEAKSATCTDKGNIEYWHCTVCDDYYKDAEMTYRLRQEETIVKALGHNYKPTWEWTGYESATVTFTCSHDSTHTSTETATISSEVTTPATCLADGLKTYTASVTFNGLTFTDTNTQTLDKLNHSFTNYVSDGNATCLADGTKTATCDREGCNETDTIADEGSKTDDHTFANGQCTVCGKVQPATEGLSFTLNSAGDSYSCSGIGSASSVRDIIIPSTYNDLPVTTIATNAFKNTYITSVTIPESVTTIEYYAFRKCSYLTTVNITEKTTNISSDAFYETTTIKYNEYDNAKYLGNAVNPYVTLVSAKDKTITSCTIHKDTKLIMNNAFTDCTSLTGITIPGSVSKIGDSAFRNCAALASATISEGVTTIGWRVFSNCSALTSIVIPNSVTSIDFAIFDGCTSLAEVSLGNGIDAIKASMFYNCTSLTSIEIPNSVTNIEGNAFYGCTKLKTVTIPSGVTEIGNSAFYNCSSITSLTIPDNIQRIGGDAFYGCNLQYNTYGNANYLGTATNDYAILISVIDKSVTSFEIHSGTKIIYARAFYNCTALKSISIPDGVVCIGRYAFSNCTSLSSVTMTDSVTYVESSVFSECTSLTSVSMGNGIEYIGSYIFMSVSAKISIAYNGTVQQWNAIDKDYGWNGAFANANANITVTCTDGTVTP